MSKTPQAIRGTQDIFGADAEAFAFVIAAAKFRELTLQLGVAQIAILLFKLINAYDGFTHSLDFSGVFTAEHLGCKLCEHRPLLL